MRTIELTVHTIDELEGDVLKAATETATNKYMESCGEIHFEEIIESARKAAEFFGMELADWAAGYYWSSYAVVDVNGYMDKGNETKNELVRWLNENYEEGTKGFCPFTGVMYDCYFFDYIKHRGGVTYNNLHVIVPEAINYLVSEAVRDEERTVEDEAYMRGYAQDMGWEFRSDGSFYGYGN